MQYTLEAGSLDAPEQSGLHQQDRFFCAYNILGRKSIFMLEMETLAQKNTLIILSIISDISTNHLEDIGRVPGGFKCLLN